METFRNASAAIQTLREGGLASPLRVVRLIQDAIASLQLDLSGLTILTEAASGPFVVTPMIAALSGAQRVLALTRDSRHAPAQAVISLTRALERLCGISNHVEIHTVRRPDLFQQADIITNLGFVRPIDSDAVAVIKPTAVITLMCEAWEYRTRDVDVSACTHRGIRVYATNEDSPVMPVFGYVGLLSLKMLLEASIEVRGSTILVVSGDKFGTVIARSLSAMGASVRRLPSLREISSRELAGADAMVVADYCQEAVLIGPDGELTPEELAHAAPGLTVVQFAGRVDVEALRNLGVVVHPGINLGARQMARTLADLGPRPVVDLHAAGLKVGEIGWKSSNGGSCDARFQSLPQELPFLEGDVEDLRGTQHVFEPGRTPSP